METININEKFSRFSKHWHPHIIAELNGQQVKLAKLSGSFMWHSHDHEDELFMVLKGVLYMKYRDSEEVVREGELIVVPKGVEHYPYTKDDEEVWVLLFEPASTLHSGNIESERTVKNQEWL